MIEKLINIYIKLKEQLSSEDIIICGSLGLVLQGYDVPHEPEDLDLLISDSLVIELGKLYNLKSGSYNGSFTIEVDGITVDLITRKDGYIEQEETYEIIDYSESIYTSVARNILFGKLYCCLNSNFTKEKHIEELYYMLSRNVDLLNI